MNLQRLMPSANLNICSLPFWNAIKLVSHSFYIRTEKKNQKSPAMQNLWQVECHLLLKKVFVGQQILDSQHILVI